MNWLGIKKYEFQNYELKCREVKIDNLKMELEKVVKERDELKVKIEKWEESSKGLNKLLNSQMSAKDRNGLGYGTQLDEMSNKSETDSEISMSVFEVRSSDEEITPANDRFSKANGYHVVPPPITGNFLTPRADISFAGLDEYAIRKKIIESKITKLNIDTSKSKTSETVGKTNEVNIEKPKSVVPKPKINRDKVIIKDWNSDDEDNVSAVKTVSPVKTNETQTVRRVDETGQISQKEGIGFKKIKACFVCKSTDHLIKDYDFYDKKSPEPKLKIVVNTGQRVVKPVWDNAKRVNQQKISNNLKYPQAIRTFIPSRVLTRTGLVNPVRPNGKRAVHTVSTARPISTARLISTARPVSTARPFAPKIAQTGSAIRPPKNGQSVVNTGKGKMDNDLKKSRWVWRPKGNYMDHESKEKGSFILKKFEAWLKSVKRLSMKKRFRKKEYVSKQGRKKSKPESTLDDSTVFDDQDHGMEYMETEEAMDEGRQSGKTEEVKLTDDTEVVEDKSSGDKGGNAEELVSTARTEIDAAR
ncbi:hypothetical protein Tco_0589398 [Tanacetum coccineum]